MIKFKEIPLKQWIKASIASIIYILFILNIPFLPQVNSAAKTAPSANPILLFAS